MQRRPAIIEAGLPPRGRCHAPSAIAPPRAAARCGADAGDAVRLRGRRASASRSVPCRRTCPGPPRWSSPARPRRHMNQPHAGGVARLLARHRKAMAAPQRLVRTDLLAVTSLFPARKLSAQHRHSRFGKRCSRRYRPSRCGVRPSRSARPPGMTAQRSVQRDAIRRFRRRRPPTAAVTASPADSSRAVAGSVIAGGGVCPKRSASSPTLS